MLAAIEQLTRFLAVFEDPTFVPRVTHGGKDDASGVIQWPRFDYAREVAAL